VKAWQRGGTGPLAAVAPCKKKMSCSPLLFRLLLSTCFIILLLHLSVMRLLHHFYSLYPLFFFVLGFPYALVSVLESWTNKNPGATPTIVIAVFALTNWGAAVAAASGREHVPSHGWRSVSAREYRPESGSARSRSVFGESWAFCLRYSQSKKLSSLSKPVPVLFQLLDRICVLNHSERRCVREVPVSSRLYKFF
jgi:hypothetical protein